MKVQELMTPSPTCCTSDTKLPEVARMMADNDCGAIPVVEDKNSKKPIGIVTDRDIVCRTVAEGKNPAEFDAASCMTDSIVCVSEDTSLEECCDTMEANQVRRVPVVDSKGACCGIVAQADIATQADNKVTGDMVQEVSQR